MTLGPASPPFETERLRLRPFCAEDWPFYADCHSRGEVYRYLYAAAPTGPALEEKFGRVLQPRFEQDGDVFLLAVIRKADDAALGEVLLKLASRDALQGEIGYIFHPDFGGQGYATEAVAAMLKVGFEEIGFHRIFARERLLWTIDRTCAARPDPPGRSWAKPIAGLLARPATPSGGSGRAARRVG